MMRNYHHITLVLVVFISLISYASTVSGNWSFSARSSAMGEAFVGLADDASAVYWNPAGLSLFPQWSVAMNYGDDSNAAEDVETLLENLCMVNPQFDSTDWLNQHWTDVWKNLKKLGDKNWLYRGGKKTNIVIAHHGTALSISSYDAFYIQPDVDTNQDNWWDAIPVGTQDNLALLLLNGFQVNEYAVSQSWLSPKSGMGIGITGRYLDIEGYYWKKSIWELDEFKAKDLLDQVDSGDPVDDNNWTLDIGIMFVGSRNRVGITGKNLNSFDLDFNEDVKLKIKPEYRIGYAYIPTDRFVWTVDYQLNESRDPTGNEMEGKTIATGFEGRLGETKWLAIRGGAIYEMDGDSPVIYTGGIGLTLPNLQLDASYAADQDGVGEKVWLGLRLRF